MISHKALQVGVAFGKFGFMLYNIVALSFRIAFQGPFSYSLDNLNLIIVDYISDCFFLIEHVAMALYSSRYASVEPESPQDEVSASGPVTAIKIMRRRSQSSISDEETRHKFFSAHLVRIFFFIPFEFIGYIIGFEHYYLLRLTKILQIVECREHWNSCVKAIESMGVTVSPGWARVMMFCIIQCILCHVAGCMYFKMGVYSMSSGEGRSNWLLHDNNASLDAEGNVIFLHGNGYLYVRSLYFAVQTVETVGFGDIAAYNLRETIFCIVLCYCALIIIQSTIANLVLLITTEDEARAQNLDRTAKFRTYSKHRKLSSSLRDMCIAYYRHQYEMLSGINEQQLVSEFPAFLQSKILKITVRDLLARVPSLKGLSNAMISALATEVQIQTYLPNDFITTEGVSVKGMYIIRRGIVVVISADIVVSDDNTEKRNLRRKISTPKIFDECDSFDEASEDSVELPRIRQLMLTSRAQHSKVRQVMKLLNALHVGDSFGEVCGDQCFSCSHQAKSFCEVLFVSKVAFQSVSSIHLSVANMGSFLANIGESEEEHIVEKSMSVKGKQRRGGNGFTGATNTVSINDSSWTSVFLGIDSLSRSVWTIATSVCVLYYMFSCPVLVSQSLYKNFIRDNMVILVLAWIADGIMLADLLLEWNCFPFLREGVLMSSRRDIAANYRQNHNLFLEVISSFPFDFLVLFVKPNYIPLLRLVKLYKVVNVWKYLKKIKGVSGAGLNRLMFLAFLLYMVIHWFGCIFVFAARVSSEVFGYDVNWIETDRNSTVWAFDYDDFDHLVLYFRSIYWALYSASSIGYYDILATNPVETMTVTLIMLFGCQILNSLVGGISSVMRTLAADKIAFQEKVKQTKDLIVRKGVDASVRNRVYYFFEYSWRRNHGVDEAKILNSLSIPLRRNVVREIAGSVLLKIPFFSRCSDSILQAILVALKLRVFVDCDTVVDAGESGIDMFIIETGLVEVVSADGTVLLAKLRAGDYLGESCLLGTTTTTRTASAYSCGYTHTYVLKGQDFRNAIEYFPEEGEKIMEGIRAELARKVAQNAQTTSAADSPNNSLERTSAFRGDPFGSDDFTEASRSKFNRHLHPDAVARKVWGLVMLFIMIYNTFMIPLRIALDISNSKIYVIDYTMDVLLLINVYCTYSVFYTIHGGLLITKKAAIKKIFWNHNFSWSFLACIPFDILAVCLIGQTREYMMWTMQLLRVPKLLLLLEAATYLNCLEDILDRLKVSYVASQVINLLLLVCMIGHWAACGFYMLPYWININVAEDCVNEPDALYGTACQFKDTWVQMQIMTGKLPTDGGDQWTRFLRAVNWAIPTLTLEVLDDVFAINSQEMMYCLIAMFFGIIINSTIVGTIISLVTAGESVSTDIQIVRELLKKRNVPKQLRDRVIGHLMFMDSSYGKLIQNENALVQELPYSLQVAIMENTKLPFLMKCPLFDYCSLQIKKNLCMAMTQHIFSDGDIIIKAGDVGNEMFFIADGEVEVCSETGTVFTKIVAGAFFGESGLVFSDRRTANIRACGFCVCYCLQREDLNNELKTSIDFDASSTVTSLKKLAVGNAKRNMAVTNNLRLSRQISHKLSRMISDVEEDDKEPALERALRDPQSTLRCVWDSLSLAILLYFAFSIPFHLAFLHSGTLVDYEPYLVIDFAFDAFWIVDMYLKSKYFPVLLISGKYDVNQSHIWKTYYSGRFWYDLIASLPLEVFALAAPTADARRICVHAYRLIHLLRVVQLFSQINVVLKQMERADIRVPVPVVRLGKALTVYVYCNHLFACIYFMIHRFLEIGSSTTWAIVDGMAEYDPVLKRHNVCSSSGEYCYFRSVYFVISTLTSVGYGDIAPYRNSEFVFQIFVIALSGACLNALVCGAFGDLWASYDTTSTSTFKKKIQVVDTLVQYRHLPAEVRDAIVAQYEYQWMLERQSGGDDTNFMKRLSPSLANEVASILHSDVIVSVPLLKHQSQRARFATALQPEIAFKGTTIYSFGDTGSVLYFICKGRITCTVPNRTSFETCKSMYLERNKQSAVNGIFERGSHIGESCVMANTSLRLSTAVCDANLEMYALDRSRLWEVFKFMSVSEQREFLIRLFTEVNDYQHTYFSDLVLRSKKQTVERVTTTSINNLYNLAADVLDEIIDEGIRHGRIPQVVRTVADHFLLQEHREGVADCPWFNALLQYEKKKIALVTESSRHTSEGYQGGEDSQLEASASDSMPMLLRKQSVEIRDDSIEDRIKALFHFIDADGSGLISREELMQGLSALFVGASWEMVDDMMSRAAMSGKCDDGGDMVMSYDDECARKTRPSEDTKTTASDPVEVSFEAIKALIVSSMSERRNYDM